MTHFPLRGISIVKNIGVTYSMNTLQWLPGEDKVFFIDENNDRIAIFDAMKGISSTGDLVFSGSSCAVLPGGK